MLREQELFEKSSALKDASAQLEKLRNEVMRLRGQEELLSDVQVRLFFQCLNDNIWKNDFSYCIYNNFFKVCIK